MKEHPIIFSAPMVRALLADRKFVTRRLSKQWLKVKAGDRLWVRETFYVTACRGHACGVGRTSDHPTGKLPDGDGGYDFRSFSEDPGVAGEQWNWANKHSGTDKWIPSIFMPRWASRILLECEEDARVERLWDIAVTEAEAIAEGCVAVAHKHWHEGMKPMIDGTRARQQTRGLPPATWTEVRRLSEVTGDCDCDPLAHTAREDFQRLWSTLHTKPGERWDDNPEVVRVGRFRRIG